MAFLISTFNNALVFEWLASDWGGAVLHEPGPQTNPLIGMPVSCNHWITHHNLDRQAQMYELRLTLV